MKVGLLCGNLVLLAPLMGAVGRLTLALHKWILYSIDIIQRLRKENSAGAVRTVSVPRLHLVFGDDANQ